MSKLRSPSRRACLKRLTGLALASAAAFPTPGSARDEMIRRLRFNVSLSNPLGRSLTKQAFWCYLPAKETATQRLVAVNVTTEHRLHSDAFGHTLLEIPFDDFPPFGQKVVGISLEVALRTSPRPIASPGDWLHAERFIEVDDPRIGVVAQQLQRNAPLETAKAIFDWVAGNLRYAGYLAEDYGALFAVTRQTGDCTEYAYLAVALARACGLPARMAGGYVVDRDAIPRAEDYHNWAEVYVNGTWLLLDAQKGNWLAPTDQYVAFRYYRAESHNAMGNAHRFRVAGDLAVRM